MLKAYCTSICTVDAVNPIRDTGVDSAMGQRASDKQREEAQLAGNRLEEPWVVKT
jgi:hypothetical protein